MITFDMAQFFDSKSWFNNNRGARYLQLSHHIQRAIDDGDLPFESQLPAERDIALLSSVSRVTVRKAIAKLVADGSIIQRQGSGSFVKKPGVEPKLEQSLSNLTSFTEYMERRGLTSESKVLSSGLFPPAPEEMLSLGLSRNDLSARISRLRTADGIPMAIELSSVPSDILPRPQDVGVSLYEKLQQTGFAPVRAIQRFGASNLNETDAKLMEMAPGSAMLQIDRTGYLANGRPVELTRGVYRSDIYDFVTELNLKE